MPSLRLLLEHLRGTKIRLSRDYRVASPVLPPVAARTDVLVIGAGLAGLAAAYLLKQAKQRVTILEAADRAGGRVWTLRKPFSNELYADMGAARIADTHYRTMWWIRHFELPLVPMYPSSGRLFGEHGGNRWFINAARVSPYAIHHLMTGYSSWGKASSEQRWRALVAETLRRPSWYRIQGGMDRLPLAFVQGLGGVIRYGCPVTAISVRPNGVDVRYHDGTSEHLLSSDYVICAVPLTTLRGMTIHPQLPEDKRRILNECQYASAVRMSFQFRDQSWLPTGWNGYGRMEEGWEIWHPTLGLSSRHSLLTVYGLAEAAHRFLTLSTEERLATAMRRLEHFFPGIEARCEASAQVCWDEETWAQGTHPIRDIPGSVMARPEGRLYFAGAHTSASGWMDGALASGHRVASEILNAATEEGCTLGVKQAA